MAIKVSYLTREVGINLWRNITLTIASILAVALSLAIGGNALLSSRGISNATDRFQAGVEFIVFMSPDAPQASLDAVAAELDANPQVEAVEFVDQEAAYREFQDIFKDDPQLLESVTADILPPSYRVTPVESDSDVVNGLAQSFIDQPGVREVVFDNEEIKKRQDFWSTLNFRDFVTAMANLVVAGLVIFNTVRMAIFARRREIEVMKLVGATNWFIRLPFVVEGVIQAMIGSALAVGAMAVVNAHIFVDFSDSFPGFTLTSGDFIFSALLVVVVGVTAGAISSAFAVTRFLKV
jgi:cell division transport system permease protein